MTEHKRMKLALKNNPAFSMLAACVSQDKTRPALNGVYFDSGAKMYITTDGRRMFGMKDLPAPPKNGLFKASPFLSAFDFVPLEDVTFPAWKGVVPSYYQNTIAFYVPEFAARIRQKDGCIVSLTSDAQQGTRLDLIQRTSCDLSFDLSLLAPLAGQEVFMHYTPQTRRTTPSGLEYLDVGPILLTPARGPSPTEHEWFCVVMPMRPSNTTSRYCLLRSSPEAGRETA